MTKEYVEYKIRISQAWDSELKKIAADNLISPTELCEKVIVTFCQNVIESITQKISDLNKPIEEPCVRLLNIRALDAETESK